MVTYTIDSTDIIKTDYFKELDKQQQKQDKKP